MELLEIFHNYFTCSKRNVIAFIGKAFPTNLANKFINKYSNSVKYKYYNDFETLSDYVESEDYGVNEGEICFAVSY